MLNSLCCPACPKIKIRFGDIPWCFWRTNQDLYFIITGTYKVYVSSNTLEVRTRSDNKSLFSNYQFCPDIALYLLSDIEIDNLINQYLIFS
jgi:hypothetical protein